jgi:predicted nucleic acid-binding protein
MTIVVDASVAVKWVIPEVLSDQAGSLRGRADVCSDQRLLARVARGWTRVAVVDLATL